MNYYEELGVAETATEEEIRRAYKKLARVLHPDQYQDEELRGICERQMARLNAIAEVLCDPARRREYDERDYAPEPRRERRGGVEKWVWAGRAGDGGDDVVLPAAGGECGEGAGPADFAGCVVRVQRAGGGGGVCVGGGGRSGGAGAAEGGDSAFDGSELVGDGDGGDGSGVGDGDFDPGAGEILAGEILAGEILAADERR